MHTDDEIAKFWAKVDARGPDQCWEWTAGRFQRGYGAFGYAGKKPGYAHRFSYEIHHGPIPQGMIIMHTCDNRPCVNPSHLKLATQRENIHDSMSKQRWMTEARREHLKTVQYWERGERGRWLPD